MPSDMDLTTIIQNSVNYIQVVNFFNNNYKEKQILPNNKKTLI